MSIVNMEAAAPTGSVFSVDVEKRTIRGLAVPFGVEALKDGKRFSFSKGTVRYASPRHVKLWLGHDKTTAVGVAFELAETDEPMDDAPHGGLLAAIKVARGPEGDKALTMADDGVWDGLSLGPSEGAKYRIIDGVYHAVDVPIHEISLTPAPVFGGARVKSVAFDAEQENSGMTDTATDTEVAAPPQTFDVSPIALAIREGFASLPQTTVNVNAGPEKVSATEGLEISEPSPYRFDGLPGAHSFAMDLRLSANGDPEARQRLDEFTEELATFAVTTANVAGLNPVRNRPDLYVPNTTFNRPLWELVTTGVLEDITAFTIPKFSSASGLVGAHVQGTEPTPGAFAATIQTVTPAAKSGKIEINREVWDQVGNPKTDGIIWNEMLQGWYEALEASIAVVLQAVGTAELQLTSAVDGPLVKALTGYFAGLQFVRGGNRFTAFAADGNLFPALVNAADTAGRPLLPILGPTNAEGTAGAAFDRVQLGNVSIRAAWALGGAGSATNQRSFSFVPSSVWAWASTPKRFEFEYQVKSVDMAIWGYAAAAVIRDSDVKPVDYQAADV